MSDLCPVCKGRRIVPLGFYDKDISQLTTVKATETCRTCNGKGMIEAFDMDRINDLYFNALNKPNNRKRKK